MTEQCNLLDLMCVSVSLTGLEMTVETPFAPSKSHHYY